MDISRILPGLDRQLDLRRLMVVCHDWDGSTGRDFAMSDPDRARALTVMSTRAWPTPPGEFHTRLFPWRMMPAPLVGSYLLGRHNVLARLGICLSVVGRDVFRREARHPRGCPPGRRDTLAELDLAPSHTA
jgi:pimeloyl-ACP methyl ester carboxylesterase